MTVSFNTIQQKIPTTDNFKLSSFYASDSLITVHSDIDEYKVQIGDNFNSCFSSSDSLCFKASDGKNYNLKNIILERLNLYIGECHKVKDSAQSSWFKRTINWCKDKFNLGHNYSQATSLIINDIELLDNKQPDIKTFFENSTGVKYNPANIEKFLKGEIKLKTEKYCEKYINKELDVKNIATPFFDKNWKSTLIKPQADIALSKSEQEKYDTLSNNLSEDYKTKLKTLLSSGELLKTGAENESSVLDNLYQIFSTPRMEGVSGIKLLKECLDLLENPCVITQQAEDIPDEYKKEAIDRITNNSKNKTTREEAKSSIQPRFLGTCSAASLEYKFATKNPAEFLRILEELTSEKGVANKTISNMEKEQLKLFNVPFKENQNDYTLTLKTGKNTDFLAQIQNNNKDEGERSIIDIVMQSMIMHVGSRQTYDALTDTRSPNESNSDNGGLIDTEIYFVDKILNSSNAKTCNYMQIDNNTILHNDTLRKKRDIMRALSENKTCTVGYVFTDDQNRISGGHEITIIGYTTNISGNGCFVCQDSDDEFSTPICMSEDFLLKNIHHMII